LAGASPVLLSRDEAVVLLGDAYALLENYSEDGHVRAGDVKARLTEGAWSVPGIMAQTPLRHLCHGVAYEPRSSEVG
jgi:hypothetical protein